ncbi:gephyrin-like molybdotransferase Glp [Planktomarina sp.]|uniref:molybdopterin-binding protein n=1 Tax=Planktomarina sp. TaxID=2024851 RepID=UPI00288E60F6|nr:molybdopterin-binding protein [Planktomarina sp.]MDT2031550.1 molybdopterin-binding protein [Planktomarina sp.]
MSTLSKLRNDCFALPAGVHWTPVSEALHLLEQRLRCCVPVEQSAVEDSDGRILANAVTAVRSHPPCPNSAVDGYAFAGGLPAGAHSMELREGRSAAGVAFTGRLVPGQALRILTGAALPDGADTVVLQEDVRIEVGQLHVIGPLRAGANVRAAGEDMQQGAEIFRASHQLRPEDLGVIAAAGLGEVAVFKRLKVAVISTGSELRVPGQAARVDQIFDANRPMLCAVLRRWGMEVVDIGIVPDEAAAVRAALDRAAELADVIITSGGASAGDEDHMSAVLRASGGMELWRIAVKPGRPLALGVWGGLPVFGLPGNPVAAFVCALIFARPALLQLAGAGFQLPQALHLPAAFSKSKKPGRREYLRARLRDGTVEVFASEGSGRVSGLSWAEGLVELPDAAAEIAPGQTVCFLPYASFGLL